MEANAAAGQRVLVVDDERALLPLLERYLKKLGYQPVCYPEPRAALEAFRATPAAFDLVMTDLTLEGISGEELAHAVLAEDPRICVVVMSGYPYTTEQFAEAERGRVTFLQKPFLPHQFQEAVSRFVVAPVVPVGVVPVTAAALPADAVPAEPVASAAVELVAVELVAAEPAAVADQLVSQELPPVDGEESVPGRPAERVGNEAAQSDNGAEEESQLSASLPGAE